MIDVKQLIPIVKEFIKPVKPFLSEEKEELKDFINELNDLAFQLYYGQTFYTEYFLMRFPDVGTESDYKRYLNYFDRPVCFNITFPQDKLIEIMHKPFFPADIKDRFEVFSKMFVGGIEPPLYAINMHRTNVPLQHCWFYYPDKFATFRDFYSMLVQLKEVVEQKAKIKFK